MIKAPVKSIILIESLPDEDKQTGSELYKDIIVRYTEYHKAELSNFYFKARAKKEFLDCFNFLIQNAAYQPAGILVHIEAHGLSDKTGLSLADGSSIVWDDLKSKLIEANVLLENQLYVTMATCYGRYLHETIDITLRTPFSGFISASIEVSEEEILEDYSPFFEELIRTCDILEAFKILDSKKSNFIYKDVETLFNGIIVDWLKKMHEDSQFKKDFFEDIRRDYDQQKQPGFPEFDSMPYEQILEIVKPEFFARYRNNFLFGKGRS